MPRLSDQLLPILLQNAAEFAVEHGAPLKSLSEQVQLAAYRAAKARAWTLDQTAEHFGVSRRKVANLSRAAKDNVAEVSEGPLKRRIEFALWLEPRTEAGVRKAFPEQRPEVVRAALDDLVAVKRVQKTKDRTPRFELMAPPDDESRRVQAARIFIDAAIRCAVNACLRPGTGSAGQAVDFRVVPEDAAELEAIADMVTDRLTVLDERAEGRRDADLYTLTIGWTAIDSER